MRQWHRQTETEVPYDRMSLSSCSPELSGPMELDQKVSLRFADSDARGFHWWCMQVAWLKGLADPGLGSKIGPSRIKLSLSRVSH